MACQARLAEIAMGKEAGGLNSLGALILNASFRRIGYAGRLELPRQHGSAAVVMAPRSAAKRRQASIVNGTLVWPRVQYSVRVC
eukprot:3111281-Prymnesium_polylepis.1